MQQDKKPLFKYCIVPLCKNTSKKTPNKVFFMIPKGVDIRKKWCDIMKRDMISPSTSLYCCEDHFDLEEDMDNYIKYKIMNLQEKHKTILRLKKGILPHKFNCENNTTPQQERHANKKRCLEIIEEAVSSSSACTTSKLIAIYSIKKEDLAEANISASQIYTEDIEMKTVCEPCCSASLSTNNKTYVDKAVQVNSKIYNRSKGVNVNLGVKKKKRLVSSFNILSKSTSISP